MTPGNVGGARARLLAALVCLVACGAALGATKSACFRVFDATLYAGKPDLSVLGVQRLSVAEPERWWGSLATSNLTARRAATMAGIAALHPQPSSLAVDLELPEDGNLGSTIDNVAEYQRVAQWIRDGGFGGTLGFYGLLPLNDYWSAQPSAGPERAKYLQNANEHYQVLNASVDALYPSLYTFYPDQAGWRRYAISTVLSARHLSPARPLYPFIWPQYHNSNATLGLQYLDASFWQVQLDTLYVLSDGLVVWGGWDFGANRQATWDPQAPWWLALQNFLRGHARVCAAQHLMLQDAGAGHGLGTPNTSPNARLPTTASGSSGSDTP